MALAILPQHPSPTAFRSQPLRRDFFSVTMDHQSQSQTRPSLPPISSLFDSVRAQQEKRESLSFLNGSPTDHGTAERSTYDDSARRRSAGSPSLESTSPERHSISRSPRTRPQHSPELPPASRFDFKRPLNNPSPTLAPTRVAHASVTQPDLLPSRSSPYPPLPDSNSYPPVPESNHWSGSSRSRNNSEPSSQGTATNANTPRQSTPPAENGSLSGLASQRPLPSFNESQPAPQTATPTDPQLAPTWQHHHYYPTTNPPSYPQTQERYICPTCSKPFSRPSSLKIHTYSHTGEKPYKCKHDGCGKHFSVRSNMKRHEKGCHGGSGGQSPSA